MKAVVFTEYGPPEVLKLKEVEKPVPRDNEVLVRIHATTVTAEDPKMRSFEHPPLLWLPIGLLFGFRKPRKTILGMELAGEIESVGKKVSLFKPGDQVFGYTGVGFGAYAEYRCIPEKGLLAAKPSNLTYAEAASLPNGALTALVYLRNKGNIQRGEKVLIYGASGSVGTAAIQLAKYFGAEVTGVCSARNMELVRSLGADTVIDYTKEDFAERRETYDIVFDTVGKISLARGKGSLKQNGRFLVTVFGISEILHMLGTSLGGGKKVIGGASNLSWKPGDLVFLSGLIEAGKLKAVVDRCYPLADAVEAHKYVEEGHKRGNVVLTVEPGSTG